MKTRLLILLVLFSFSTQIVFSQETEKKLIIGIKESPPFIIKEKGSYQGICIDLWQEIATQMGYQYEFREYDLSGLLDAISTGEVDLSINPLTVTADRMERFSFTQPFFVTNLGIAVKAKHESNFWDILEKFFSWSFLRSVTALFMVIFLVGLVVWLIERRKNKEHFHQGARGIGDGMWWSAVTMTTVGYGDKAPKTALGRIVSIIWMFAAIILISSFTAAIASSLTVNRLSSSINSIDDLHRFRVGSINGSAPSLFLMEYGIKYDAAESIEDGLNELNDDDIQAFVYDEAILRYLITSLKLDDRVIIIPSAFSKEYYSFASGNTILLNQIDPALVRIVEMPEYSRILEKYGVSIYK